MRVMARRSGVEECLSLQRERNLISESSQASDSNLLIKQSTTVKETMCYTHTHTRAQTYEDRSHLQPAAWQTKKTHSRTRRMRSEETKKLLMPKNWWREQRGGDCLALEEEEREKDVEVERERECGKKLTLTHLISRACLCGGGDGGANRSRRNATAMMWILKAGSERGSTREQQAQYTWRTVHFSFMFGLTQKCSGGEDDTGAVAFSRVD